MNFRTTILLLIVLIAAGAMLLLTRDRIPQSNKQQVENTEGTRILDVPSAQVNKLMITPAGEQPIVLERDGVNWKLTAPVNAPAEATTVTQLVDDLSNLRSRGQLAADQASLRLLLHQLPKLQLGLCRI